jgi:gamma-glutamyltranspeptidase/glutathione hydrolase
MNFNSRRSPVYSTHGMVSTSQPLASQIGLRILEQGGNATDAAIAILATLAVIEPCSTGLGGDCFALFYNGKDKKVYGINGSGRTPSQLTLERYLNDVKRNKKMCNAHHVTIPGAVRAWEDMLLAWGSGTKTWSELLKPAENLAREGFPVPPVTAYFWKNGLHQLAPYITSRESPLFVDPTQVEVIQNLDIARSLQIIGELGASKGFYSGEIAQAICSVVQQEGGLLSMEDLAFHNKSEFVTPLKLRYRNVVDVYEIPPNGQGIAALMALQTFEHVFKQQQHPSPLQAAGHNRDSSEHLHLLIESMKTAFIDARTWVCDHMDDVENKMKFFEMLLHDEKFIKERIGRVKHDIASGRCDGGVPVQQSETISFQVVDVWGNAISVVNSNYEGFGSGIVPKGFGFTLQNRGKNFIFNVNQHQHGNILGPRKRPYHTIIPAMILNCKDQSLFASLTNMGGFMQPQGHLQLISNLIDFGDNPQDALDHGRFCVDFEGIVNIEESLLLTLPNGDEIINNLIKKGHPIRILKGWDRVLFGRGQIIMVKEVMATTTTTTNNNSRRLLIGGSDGRCDGVCVGY